MGGGLRGDHGHDALDNLFRGLRNVHGQARFVIFTFLEILQLRWQQRGRHVLVSPGRDPGMDQADVAAGEDGEHGGGVFPQQVSVAALKR
jgi:hypothetical protein